eukprot:130867_1
MASPSTPQQIQLNVNESYGSGSNTPRSYRIDPQTPTENFSFSYTPSPLPVNNNNNKNNKSHHGHHNNSDSNNNKLYSHQKPIFGNTDSTNSISSYHGNTINRKDSAHSQQRKDSGQSAKSHKRIYLDISGQFPYFEEEKEQQQTQITINTANKDKDKNNDENLKSSAIANDEKTFDKDINEKK